VENTNVPRERKRAKRENGRRHTDSSTNYVERARWWTPNGGGEEADRSEVRASHKRYSGAGSEWEEEEVNMWRATLSGEEVQSLEEEAGEAFASPPRGCTHSFFF
jgi:hypothetical protein